MKGELVSVVLPAYNHERYVEQAVRSVLDQTYKHLELLVVDDGSKDRTAELAERAMRGDRRARIIRQANAGAHAAINRGVRKTSGKLVTILNSDDFYHPQRLASLVDFKRRTDSELLFTLLDLVDGEGARLPGDQSIAYWYQHVISYRHHFPTLGHSLLTGNLAVTTGNFFFSRALFERLGGFRAYRMVHDLDFIYRALEWTEPALLSKSLMSYRVHGSNSITEGQSGTFQNETREIVEEFFERVLETAAEGKAFANARAPHPISWPRYFGHFIRCMCPAYSDVPFMDSVSFLNGATWEAPSPSALLSSVTGEPYEGAARLLRGRPEPAEGSWALRDRPLLVRVKEARYQAGAGTLLKVELDAKDAPPGARLVILEGEKILGSGRPLRHARGGTYLVFLEGKRYLRGVERDWVWAWLPPGEPFSQSAIAERERVVVREGSLQWRGRHYPVVADEAGGALRKFHNDGFVLVLDGWSKADEILLVLEGERLPALPRRPTRDRAGDDFAFRLSEDVFEKAIDRAGRPVNLEVFALLERGEAVRVAGLSAKLKLHALEFSPWRGT